MIKTYHGSFETAIDKYLISGQSSTYLQQIGEFDGEGSLLKRETHLKRKEESLCCGSFSLKRRLWERRNFARNEFFYTSGETRSEDGNTVTKPRTGRRFKGKYM